VFHTKWFSFLNLFLDEHAVLYGYAIFFSIYELSNTFIFILSDCWY
jgi:hypothetical protein